MRELRIRRRPEANFLRFLRFPRLLRVSPLRRPRRFGSGPGYLGSAARAAACDLGSLTDINNVYGYSASQTMTAVLKAARY